METKKIAFTDNLLKKTDTQNEILLQIARYLMLHGSFTKDIGLLQGKTGIAIFLYHYAQYTGKKYTKILPEN